jgi:hypothetical protein
MHCCFFLLYCVDAAANDVVFVVVFVVLVSAVKARFML